MDKEEELEMLMFSLGVVRVDRIRHKAQEGHFIVSCQAALTANVLCLGAQSLIQWCPYWGPRTLRKPIMDFIKDHLRLADLGTKTASIGADGREYLYW